MTVIVTEVMPVVFTEQLLCARYYIHRFSGNKSPMVGILIITLHAGISLARDRVVHVFAKKKELSK